MAKDWPDWHHLLEAPAGNRETMSVSRREKYVSRVRRELHTSLAEDATPHQVASSFAIGTFITMLPTLGTGLILFVILVYCFDWINKIALFASVLVFNPVVKWGVYALSLALGFALLGPVEGVGVFDQPSLSDGSAILYRLLLGNLILAIVATVAAYFAAYKVAAAYHEHELPVLEQTVDHIVDELEKREDIASEDPATESGADETTDADDTPNPEGEGDKTDSRTS